MPTNKARLNITLPEHLKKMLSQAAKRDNMPQATKATDLLEIALELEEDQVWDNIASQRDTTKNTYISHEKAWK